MGPAQAAEANRRLRLIQAYEARQPLKDNVSARTVRQWLHRYRHAEAMQGDGYLGLLPRFHDCGNRNSRLPEKTKALMLNIIGTDYETVKQKRKFHVYGALIRACESEGTMAPSYKTFSLAINRRLQSELVFNRRGRRAAYQVEPPYLELRLTTPRHGDRPFHICHIEPEPESIGKIVDYASYWARTHRHAVDETDIIFPISTKELRQRPYARVR